MGNCTKLKEKISLYGVIVHCTVQIYFNSLSYATIKCQVVELVSLSLFDSYVNVKVSFSLGNVDNVPRS